MQKSTIDSLRSLAPDLIRGKLPYPIPAHCQHALAILEILRDGEWHTARQIGEKLGIGKKYAGDILRVCREPWKLKVSNPKGWMLVKKQEKVYE